MLFRIQHLSFPHTGLGRREKRWWLVGKRLVGEQVSNNGPTGLRGNGGHPSFVSGLTLASTLFSWAGYEVSIKNLPSVGKTLYNSPPSILPANLHPSSRGQGKRLLGSQRTSPGPTTSSGQPCSPSLMLASVLRGKGKDLRSCMQLTDELHNAWKPSHIGAKTPLKPPTGNRGFPILSLAPAI